MRAAYPTSVGIVHRANIAATPPARKAAMANPKYASRSSIGLSLPKNTHHEHLSDHPNGQHIELRTHHLLPFSYLFRSLRSLRSLWLKSGICADWWWSGNLRFNVQHIRLAAFRPSTKNSQHPSL